MAFAKGDVVVRVLDSYKYAAKVLDVNHREKVVRLQYLDDGNVEDGVSFEEVEVLTENNGNYAKQSTASLIKPLLGLVEDDIDIRKNHKPTVFIHKDIRGDDENKAPIILNGAENRLAAGGGLTALRYLKS